MERKRIRSANFTPEEISLCLSLISNYRDIVDCKTKNTAVTWRDKEKAWMKIEAEFNSQSPAGISRTKESLKKFYENRKKINRKLASMSKVVEADSNPVNNFITDPIFKIASSVPEAPFINLKNELDGDGIRVPSSLLEEDSLHFDSENTEVSSGDHLISQSDIKLLTIEEESRSNFISTNGECSSENFHSNRNYEENFISNRRRQPVSATTALARKYEELAAIKIQCSHAQLQILKLEKESAVERLHREKEENKRKVEEDYRKKEEQERKRKEHELQKERDEELFNLQRQSLLLDIEIKKCQLQKLKST